MDKFSRLRLFLEVADELSFTKAAKKLGLTGPAVSKQVRVLESQLGVTLFHRTTRHVSLTKEGASYQVRVRRILEDLEEADSQVQDLRMSPRGTLRVSLPMSFGHSYLSRHLALFAKQYPEVCLDIDLDDRKVDPIAENFDVVLRIGSPQDSSLIIRKLADCPLVLCASPAYLKENGYPTLPSEITDHQSIIYTKHGTSTEWKYRLGKGPAQSVHFKRGFSANNAEIILEACLQSIGIALLPIFSVVEYLKNGDLVQLLPEYTSLPELSIYVLFPENRYMSHKVRLFVDSLVEFGKSLPFR